MNIDFSIIFSIIPNEATSIYLSISQIIATLSGLFAIFTFQRINSIREIIIGDGKSHLRRETEDFRNKRYKKINKEIKKIDKRNLLGLKRLKDAIDRKNLYGIKEAIYKCDYREIKAHNLYKAGKLEGKKEKIDLLYKNGELPNLATGYFHNVKPRFDALFCQLNTLKRLLFITIIFLFISILFIFYILIGHQLFFCLKPFIFYATLFLSLFLISIVLYISLFNKMPHEKEKNIKECKRINKLIKNETPKNLKRYLYYKK
jgi:hypothetical protein